MDLKKILVTGSDGYIGAGLVNTLEKNRYSVTGIDTSYFKSTIGATRKIKTIKKDIRGIDAIIHLAGLSNDSLGELNPKLTREINYKATIRLARLAKRSGVKRFIFSSSCSVYGIAKTVVNENSKVKPLTEYSKNKYLAEKQLLKLSDKNFCVIILRNATVYGYSPKFRDDLVVNNLFVGAILTKKIVILSDGKPWRPLIDVRDLSNFFVLFLKIETKKVNGKVFNVGFNENNYKVIEIANLISKKIKNCKIEILNTLPNDARSYQVNFSKLKKLFPKYKQQWPLKKAINDLYQNLKSHNIKKNSKDKSLTRIS